MRPITTIAVAAFLVFAGGCDLTLTNTAINGGAEECGGRCADATPEQAAAVNFRVDIADGSSAFIPRWTGGPGLVCYESDIHPEQCEPHANDGRAIDPARMDDPRDWTVTLILNGVTYTAPSIRLQSFVLWTDPKVAAELVILTDDEQHR